MIILQKMAIIIRIGIKCEMVSPMANLTHVQEKAFTYPSNFSLKN